MTTKHNRKIKREALESLKAKEEKELKKHNKKYHVQKNKN